LDTSSDNVVNVRSRVQRNYSPPELYKSNKDMTNGGQKHKSSAAFHFAAGLGSGVTSAFLLQPADLLKTRVQQSSSASLSVAFKSILAGPSPIQQ
ncbi:hypothetical protein KCU67_g16701, partial [Aureobasidium melanogenum]